jgi:hypothetical protein
MISGRSNKGTLRVVDIDPGNGEGKPFRTGTPRLVRSDMPRAVLDFSYGLTHNGDAILGQVDDGTSSDEIRVIVNWLDELKRVVPN